MWDILYVRTLDVGQPLQQLAFRDLKGPYINNYPGWYLSFHSIWAEIFIKNCVQFTGTIFSDTQLKK